MANKNAISSWMKELWKELTTPPAFMNIPARSKQGPPKNRPTATDEESRRRPYRNQSAGGHGGWDDETAEQPREDVDLILRANRFAPKILHHYPFVVKRVVPFGSVMQLHTSDGIVGLKRSHASQKRLEFMAKALQYAERNGFSRFARIIPNSKKNLFTPLGEQIYYATEWISGEEADFSSMLHIAAAASAIAEFHHASRGFAATGYNPPGAFGLNKVLQSRAKDFDLILDKARGKRKPDAVDRFVIRRIPAYKKQAQQAAKLLEDRRCRDFLLRDQTNPGLCHLDITPKNLIYARKNGMHLIDFELLSFGPRMLDIGHFIRRCLQDNDWVREPALIALVQVNRVQPLLHAEYQILQALLTFPHPVWRSCRNHYMGKPTPYTLARLERLQEQEPARQAFLEDFASHVERHRGN
ncbi:phosphotransferase [Effusibacillus pohliae]|uniref:phosphotransferase n=1 Tax=Effusibacillus pohliae TaxID=232270 RepID=UPI00036CD344|nr:phosphotransferase [Effusibacillus pohliae]